MDFMSTANDQLMFLGKLAAFDFTVTSLLVPNSLPEASVTARSAVFAAEEHTHRSNDAKCAELGELGAHPACSGDIGLLGYRS